MRRSLSESREIDYLSLNNEKVSLNQLYRMQQTWNDANNKRSGMAMGFGGVSRRRTSADMINEAKWFLKTVTPSSTATTNLLSSSKSLLDIVNNVKVVHTRRPITPRETSRFLYGRVLLAERPPSSVSLRYLQNENLRSSSIKTPTLEPITREKHLNKMTDNFQMAQSTENANPVIKLSAPMKSGKLDNIPHKLPALEQNEKSLSKKGASRCPESVVNSDQNRVINLLNSKKIIHQNVNDLLAQSSIEQLVEMLKQYAGLKECTEETVTHIYSILLQLYEKLKKKEETYKKAFILSGLYGLVECISPKILLALAKIVLSLRVSGSNLTGACKLIFKVSRNEQNDHLFRDNDILELLVDGLGRASPLEDPEACIYGYGAIRFLAASTSHDNSNLNSLRSDTIFELSHKQRLRTVSEAVDRSMLGIRLAEHGAIELMVLHLQMLNEAGINKSLKGRPLHSLYQLSAALRAMADLNQYSTINEGNQNFLKHLELACPHLIKAAEINLYEIEVQTNIIRTLSILSEDEGCCHILHKYAARLGILMGPYCNKQQITAKEKTLSCVSRLGYILGNIMAVYDSARLEFYHNDVAMEYLINILNTFSKEPFTFDDFPGDSVVDVLIKVIRIIANISVNTDVGKGLCNQLALGDILLGILESTKNMNNNKTQYNELVLACLGALHNLCFYQEKLTVTDERSSIKGNLRNILLTLIQYSNDVLNNNRDRNDHEHDDSDNHTILVEIARVLGNLTRNESVRQEFHKTNGLHILIQMLTDCKKLSHLSHDLKVCIVGVLVNVLGDVDNRKPFIKLMGVEALFNLLKDALIQSKQQHHHQQPVKWFLATIICQALWNLFVDNTTIIEFCPVGIINKLMDLLLEELQEHQQQQQHLDTTEDNSIELWEDFQSVAADLLEHIRQNIIRQNNGNVHPEDVKIYMQNMHDI